MEKNLEEGQIVLCTVDRIAGTIVFVKIEDYGVEGTITFSEISPGRIRNIRDYAFPGKKIICKILEIKPSRLTLSLRRVKLKEKTEFNERLRLEKSLKAIFKTVLNEKSKEIVEKIKNSEEDFIEFIDQSKSSPEKLEAYISKDQASKILKIINEKKTKEKVVGKKFKLSSKKSGGMDSVKKIISESRGKIEADITYVSAGNYVIKIKTTNLKQADQQITEMLEKVETLAKKGQCSFLIGESIN